MGRLTDKAIQAAQPREKPYKLADGDGLALVVQPTGKKLWWLRYRFSGKEKTLSLGRYPLLSLKEAREQTFLAKKKILSGIDPHEEKKEANLVLPTAFETVETVAREWFDKFSKDWADTHASKIIRRLEVDLFPWVGSANIAEVTPAKLLTVVRRVESRGAIETAHRLLNNCGQVWRYAVATGRAERDITVDLKGAIPPTKSEHLGAIVDPREIGILLRNIDDYTGSAVVRIALKIAAHLFVRPGELRQAMWSEFDLKSGEWVIPENRMKSRKEHVVPLSNHVIQMLEELRQVSGNSEYLFPTPNSKTRCISNMALLAAIRRMGYEKGEMTAHGFRGLASTNLEQLGYDVRVIELQLAHADRDDVRAAYKRDTSRLQLEKRRKMMAEWSDYLEGLQRGAEVIPFRFAQSENCS